MEGGRGYEWGVEGLGGGAAGWSGLVLICMQRMDRGAKVVGGLCARYRCFGRGNTLVMRDERHQNIYVCHIYIICINSDITII